MFLYVIYYKINNIIIYIFLLYINGNWNSDKIKFSIIIVNFLIENFLIFLINFEEYNI